MVKEIHIESNPIVAIAGEWFLMRYSSRMVQGMKLFARRKIHEKIAEQKAKEKDS